MKISDIKANTPEWREIRKKYVGASEIYGILYHYKYNELKKIAYEYNYKKIEKPFKSAYEIWHKLKYGHELEIESSVDGIFGKEMEKYIILYSRLKSNININLKNSINKFVINSNIHKLAACSPDIFIEKNILSEIKTSRFSQENQPKLKYITQLLYQMIICEMNKGTLIIASSKNKEKDSDFERGRILGTFERGAHTLKERMILEEFMEENFNIYEYFYDNEIYSNLQNLCFECLDLLEADLALDNEPIAIDYETGEPDLIFRNKELKLKTMLNQAQFGPIKVNGQELDQDLEEYKHGKEQIIAINQELERGAEYNIRLALMNNMELIGTNYRAHYDKGNKLRVQKIT